MLCWSGWCQDAKILFVWRHSQHRLQDGEQRSSSQDTRESSHQRRAPDLQHFPAGVQRGAGGEGEGKDENLLVTRRKLVLILILLLLLLLLNKIYM